MIDIALIHPQPVYRKGLSLLLMEGIHDITVVASTKNLRDLINLHRHTAIDVIVWDIPSHHVLTPGTRLLKECFPLAKILVLVTSRNAVYGGLLQTLGANAVISADCEINDLYQAILRLHETYAPPPSSNHVQEPSAHDAGPNLNNPELKVLESLNQGLTIAEIAKRLEISKSEVTCCWKSLKNKLGVKNLASLLEKGIELQLIKSKNHQSEQ